MLKKEKFMENNKTVLAKIGITKKIVNDWKQKGLKISYPMRKQRKFFKSDDGAIFVEGADKFVPHLTKKEINTYIKNPKKFKEDFFRNAKFFRKFVDFVYRYQEKVKKLEKKYRIPTLLSLIYLFHRAMDYHYFHWDRYLVYEDYPSTPVGYWLKKLKGFYFKVKKEKISKSHLPEEFLKLLSLDRQTLKNFKDKLSKKEFEEFKTTLNAIKTFEEIQQGEINFFLDYKNKQHLFLKTILPMWAQLEIEIKEQPDTIKKGKSTEIKKILNSHPLVGTRKIFFPTLSRYFDKKIVSQFKKEIKRWLA